MPTIRIAALLSVLFLLSVGLSTGPSFVYAQGANVEIQPNSATLGDKAYVPNPAEVKVGESVTWTNGDSQIHTVTSGTVGSADSGSVFDSSILSPKATFDHTFETAGEYDYYCTLHPQMFGKITVS